MKIKREIKIGFIYIVGIIILIWGINFLKSRHIFTSERKFYAVYNSVNGLVPANPVVLNGLKIGKVDKVDFLTNGNGKIQVAFTVTTNLPFPDNTIAKIVSTDLMGSKSVELILGNSKTMLVDGATLKSSLQGSLQEEVNMQILPLKRKAEDLMLSLDSVLTVVRAVFNEDTRENLSKSFESIKVTIDNLEHTTFTLDTLFTTQKSKLAAIFSNVESITMNIKENNGRITNIIKNFSSISDSLAKADFARVIKNANEALAETNQIVGKINSGKGSLGLLINNDSLYVKLNKASNELGLLLEDVKLNPKRYVHFSLFGGKSKSYQLPAKP